MSKVFSKQPREIVDYDIDMTAYFEDINDEISTALIEIDPVTASPLLLGPGALADYEKVGTPAETLKIWLGDGLAGEKYKVTALITTVQGRKEEIEFYVKVKET